MDRAEEALDTTDTDALVSLELSLCKACGICIAVCPTAVFDRDDMGYPVVARPSECTACLLCELHCPDFALEIARRPRKRPGKADEAADRERVRAAVTGGTLDAGRALQCDPHDVEG